MRIWRAIAVVMGLAIAGPIFAQETTVDAEPVAPSVLILDMDRLYSSSDYAESMRAAVEVDAEALRVENERIVADLTEEERSLTERRPGMSVEAFRAEAAAFDAKVQDIRQARDAKENELNQARAEVRLRFFEDVRPLIGRLMVEKGALAVLDSRTVVVVRRAIDITDEAISRIDQDLLQPVEN